jgi:membrane-bound metal-dependent hydrolase YbcI (DUF457 family)
MESNRRRWIRKQFAKASRRPVGGDGWSSVTLHVYDEVITNATTEWLMPFSERFIVTSVGNGRIEVSRFPPAPKPGQLYDWAVTP